MGTIDELGYAVKPANAFQRLMQRIAATKPAAWVFQRTLYVVDRPLQRWTKGRITVPGLVAGLPVVVLTTTGAKSGEPRTMPLVGIPLDGDLAVIGSNYGQTRTPGWVFNLESDPHATVAWRDRRVDVVARPADDVEVERAFAAGGAMYPGFDAYRERAAHRRIRVFVLEPARDATTP
jgi:deazaflavin-dependent oxidoreductase (nitroreductase family)